VLRGRLDRVVKIEGKRLSLPELEQRLQSHAWVAAAAAVPLPAPLRLGVGVVPTPRRRGERWRSTARAPSVKRCAGTSRRTSTRRCCPSASAS
jgi:acyl-coenzyme A synthetase/AMP-(fatty) acid ligase